MNNQQVMTEPGATPPAMATSPSVAASPTSLSDDSNDDEEEDAPVSSFYCRVYFESEVWLEGLTSIDK
jgi:hypothetical protein